MNKENIQKIIDVIKLEDTPFSMGYFTWTDTLDVPDDSLRGECGTPACIQGWANHLMPEEFFRAHDTKAFKVWCGLSDNQDYGIALPHCCGNANYYTRKRAIAMLENFIDTNKVNWAVLDGVSL